MGEWLSYRPSDFLLFGPEAYWHLFAQGNLAFWPLILVFLALGFALFAFARLSALPRRLALIGLATAWAFVSWDFFATRYAAINWAAPAIAPVFGLQALALLAFAAAGAQPRPSRAAPIVIGYAVILHPLWPFLAGRPLNEAELLGLAPDPTAIATLGMALLLRRGVLLAVLPALWLALSATTLLTMARPEALAPVVALLFWVVAALLPGRRASTQSSRNAFR